MSKFPLVFSLSVLACCAAADLSGQVNEPVRVTKVGGQNKVNVFIGDKLFTSFLYPDTLPKPVLFPVNASNGTTVTRAYPLLREEGEPNDHPHHVGVWFTFENLNGLDFWNNSFAIPADKKHQYGWIRTDHILKISNGAEGGLSFHANWTNQAGKVLAEETTAFRFAGSPGLRIIDRTTKLQADTALLFKDAKDGLLGFRLAHALQIPTDKDQEFTDDKGNKTIVKGGTDKVANGNYLASTGLQGDSVWSTRARWCRIAGKMGKDSVSVIIFDHPSNINYPTFWHARGYGLFAANPLGEKIFTNGKSEKNLSLKQGESVQFRYRIVIHNGTQTLSASQLDAMADAFARE